MPGYHDHGHGPGGGRGFHDGAGWFGAPDPLLALVLPASLIVLALIVLALYRTGYLNPLWGEPARTPGRDVRVAAWRAAVLRHDETARAFAAYECDPHQVLARPALSDVSRPATARFVDAFAAATALRTDDYPGEPFAAEFVRAAEAADRAWSAAVEAADRVRWASFAPGERKLLGQTVRLLTTLGESPFPAERRSAYQRALTRLTELERRTGWGLPAAAAATMQDRARGMVTAAS